MESNNKTVNTVINFIEENIESDIDLDEIARNAGYSKFHLNRLFSEATGTTIYKYVQSRRLTAAAEKLVYTDLPIAQIAYEAAYNSQQAFTLAFRQAYGCPPKAYRHRGVMAPRQNNCSMSLRRCLTGGTGVEGRAA